MNAQRFKILIVAYACEPGRGSEPEVGWRWSLQLARRHDVWVITRANNRGPIEATEEGTGPTAPRFVYVDLPPWARPWKKGNRSVHPYYLLWQGAALIRATALAREVGFDAVHHITFSPLYHAPLAALLPLPFVWGPIGAGERMPKSFLPLFTPRQRAREALRAAIRRFTRFNPLVRLSLRRARLIVAATSDTANAVPHAFRAKVLQESQIGMDPSPGTGSAAAHGEEEPAGGARPFRVVTAGRHMYWKGTILVVRAFARFLEETGAAATLEVLSDGPERPRLEREAEALGISDRVRFLGWMPTREAVLETVRSADVFAYASLFECGGYVVLEALAVGTPVVCLDLGGPGEIVDGSCGLKVSATDPTAAATGLARALGQLEADRETLAALSRGAFARVGEEFSWNVKGDRLDRALQRVLGDRSSTFSGDQ